MRAVLTAFRILLIALSGAVLSTVALCSVALEKNGRLYFWSGRAWSRFILWLCRIRVTVKGTENLEPDGKYIFVSNHASMFDIPTVLATFPRVRIMFKKELSLVPILGWALRYGHHIIVDRQNASEAFKSIERAAETVVSGGSVHLFAEGTRTRNGSLLPFKRGAFSLAAKAGAPVVPVAINGSFRILPKGSFDIRPHPIELIIGKPIPTVDVGTRDEEVALMNRVREIIERNYKLEFVD